MFQHTFENMVFKNMRIIEIGEKGPYSCLSNYSTTPFKDNDVEYISALHAYYTYLQPEKSTIIRVTRSFDELQTILGYDTYKSAASIMMHKKKYNFHRTFDFLRTIILLKVMSNPDVKARLLGTKDAYLSVLNRNDLVLGCGKSRMGLNLTGLMLMHVRDYFMNCRNPIVYQLFNLSWHRIGFVPYENLNESKSTDSDVSTLCEDPVPV